MPSTEDRKLSTKLSNDQEERALEIIARADAVNMSEAQIMAIVNSGVLGYNRRTNKQIIENEKPKPITIGRDMFLKFRKIIRDPEYQKQELLNYAQEGFTKEVIKLIKITAELKDRSFQNLLMEKDPSKNQQIINGITRNLIYWSNIDGMVKRMVEKKKLPGVNNEIKN